MSTEIARHEGGGLAPRPPVRQFEGDATDILMPRLYAAQKTSKIIESAGAKFGELLRSTTNEVLGGLGKPVAIIPLRHWKTWMITEAGGKFCGNEPFTAANATLPFEYEQDGKKYKRERMLNFFVLLPGDVKSNLEARRKFAETGEMPEKVVSLTPCQIGFKSTSYKAGRTLATHFAQMEDFGAKPYQRWLNLDSEIAGNDSGKFAILKVSEGGAVKDPEQIAICERWHAILKSTSNVKVDDSGRENEMVNVVVDVSTDF